MELKDAVNIVLRTANRDEVDDTNESNAQAQRVIRTITQKRKEILRRGWPFNEDVVTLSVGTNDRVELDSTYLQVQLPSSVRCTLSYRVDGGVRYLWDIDNNEYYSKEVQKAEVTFDVTTFTELPEAVAQWIAYESAVRFYAESGAGGSVPQLFMEDYRRAKANALNSMCHGTIHEATGWSRLTGVGAKTAPAGKQIISL